MQFLDEDVLPDVPIRPSPVYRPNKFDILPK